jgi:hypothetical protein
VGNTFDADAGGLLERIIESGAQRGARGAADVGDGDLLGRTGPSGPDRRQRDAGGGHARCFQKLSS